MGRFDALTQLDTKPEQAAPLAENSTPLKKSSKNQVASKPANQQGSKEVNQQTSKPASIQISKEASQQTSLPANQQGSKQLKKFSSYLTEKSLKVLKRIAFETERKDYEVLQEAVDQYLQNK